MYAHTEPLLTYTVSFLERSSFLEVPKLRMSLGETDNNFEFVETSIYFLTVIDLSVNEANYLVSIT